MRRIQIIGCGGSGKSTLAVALGELLGIEVFHLDRIFWKPGWQALSREAFTAELETIFPRDAWIMDGNYSATMDLRCGRSDTLIFLDLPTWQCLLGILRRRLAYSGRSRPDMTAGNPERLTGEFLRWVLCYRRTRRPAIFELLERHRLSRRIVVLRSRREVADFLDELADERGAA